MPHSGVSQPQRLEPAKEKTRLGYAKSRQYGGVLCERRVFPYGRGYGALWAKFGLLEGSM